MAKKSTSQKKKDNPPKDNPPKTPVDEVSSAIGDPGVIDRSTLLEWLRSELVGPQLRDHFPREEQQYVRVPQVLNVLPLKPLDASIQINPAKSTVLFHTVGEREQEIVWYRESPRQRYGTGVLYPEAALEESTLTLQKAEEGDDQLVQDDVEDGDALTEQDADDDQVEEENVTGSGNDGGVGADTDDLEVASRDRFRPSTMGLSFHVKLSPGSEIRFILPEQVSFPWQVADRTFPVNGWYRKTNLRYSITTNDQEKVIDVTGYARYPVTPGGAVTPCTQAELVDDRSLTKPVVLPTQNGFPACPLKLEFRIYPRQVRDKTGQIRADEWLITVVLRNRRNGDIPASDLLLFQTYFEVQLHGESATFLPYPESHVRFENLTEEEKNLELLYQDHLVWGTGHGCAAGWDGAKEKVGPTSLRAEVLPAVETPSMTPDLTDKGVLIKVALHELKDLPDATGGPAWAKLYQIQDLYGEWIKGKEQAIGKSEFPDRYRETARNNIEACKTMWERLKQGIALLAKNKNVRRAFRLANHSMLLQSLATKQLMRRSLVWNPRSKQVEPDGEHANPDTLLRKLLKENSTALPTWRAFQIAFLLMSLGGIADPTSPDREIVDLIWFPTGGGKTEAYLAVATFLMFHERIAGCNDNQATDVLMRYTLRMLTTQQFQRAAALICAMEWLRKQPENEDLGERRFTLGLWIGNEASPGNASQARKAFTDYKRYEDRANPLIVNECPWCRAEIGKCRSPKPKNVDQWDSKRIQGIEDRGKQGIVLCCPDAGCFFNRNEWEDTETLPIEVVDDRIYGAPPSFLIGTADKFAMLAYRPEAGSLFGFVNGKPVSRPPALILQDELHLISGPLGTMYGMYETVIERLCTDRSGSKEVRPKIICSTATIRGATEQVKTTFRQTSPYAVSSSCTLNR